MTRRGRRKDASRPLLPTLHGQYLAARALRSRTLEALARVHAINLIRIVVVLFSHGFHAAPRPRAPARPDFLQLGAVAGLLRGAHRLEAALGLLLVLERVVDDFLLGVGFGAGARGVAVCTVVVGVGAFPASGLAAHLFHEGFGLGGVLALLADGGTVLVEEEGEGETGEGEEGRDGRSPVDSEVVVHLGGELYEVSDCSVWYECMLENLQEGRRHRRRIG